LKIKCKLQGRAFEISVLIDSVCIDIKYTQDKRLKSLKVLEMNTCYFIEMLWISVNFFNLVVKLIFFYFEFLMMFDPLIENVSESVCVGGR
jgi:predicted membrane protein